MQIYNKLLYRQIFYCILLKKIKLVFDLESIGFLSLNSSATEQKIFMKDLRFSLWNKVTGWVVFAIALLTYALTVEPTASFWDPGEFITTSAKLQVGHPPGAPLFQMVGAVFSWFAPNPTQIALLVNYVSVVSSAFTILFLFWSLSLLIRKISGPAETLTPGGKIAVLGSAAVGALAFTFTDSFWFSAVEAEVYAMAMCFMSALFYVGLLWERDMLKPRGNRWLILLSFLIGLTFGVHFLGLLTIPAIGYLYYFKHTPKITVKNFIVASVAVVGVLLFIFLFLLPYTLTFFASSEVFFVNSIGLPFDSGTVIAGLLLGTLLYLALRYTRKKGYVNLNTITLCILFIFVGFSSWIMLAIRANAGTPINENNPENARELLAYYNREQYPENPLLYGPQFTDAYAGLDEKKPYIDDEPKYEENHKTGKYDIVNKWKNAKQNSSDKQKTFLPRMWSTQPDHIENYMRMTGPVKFRANKEGMEMEGFGDLVQEVKIGYEKGQIEAEGLARFLKQYSPYLTIEKPSTAANFQFMFQYQFWYMYFRYFMWNFVGRQNDEQGKYDNLNGNWLSGIPFIDSIFLGSQKNLPDIVKNDPSRNTYYFLPLILGLIGLFFQYDRDKNNFWVLMVLFLFTGLALKIYLNERPFEPRERDYALVGSFYAFTFWIGFGVYSLYDKLKRYIKPGILAPVLTLVCLLAVPVVMAKENWHDHDRSIKRTATAMAKNYLDSVEQNGILFTIGDNDTFPLWYVQEIEGYRQDVRIINTSLFATDWYIDQMKRKTYDSEGIKTILEHKDYTYGTNDQIIYNRDERIPDTISLKNWIKYIKSDNPSTSLELQNGQRINTFPTRYVTIPVNIDNAIKGGTIDEKDADQAVSEITIKITGNQIGKNTLMMLDVLANNNWERPIYFSGGSFGDADYLWMKDYLELDGLTYKLVPIKTKSHGYEMGRIDTDKMYNRIMNWHWGNSGNPKMYHDPQTRRNGISYRSNIVRTVQALIAEGKEDKAQDILDLSMEKMPVKQFGFYSILSPIIASYYKIGETEKARSVWNEVATIYQQKLEYYGTWSPEEQELSIPDIFENMQRYRDLVDIAIMNEDEETAKAKATTYNHYIDLFPNLMQDAGELEYDDSEENMKEQVEDSVENLPVPPPVPTQDPE